MKAFTGLLGMLLLGAILAEDSLEDSSQSEEESECTNFAGELYFRVEESLPDDEDFVISPLGVSSLLGTLLFAVNRTSAIEIANFIYPKCDKSSEDISSPSVPEPQGSQLTMATVALVRRGVDVDKQFVDQAAELGSYVFKTSFWRYRNEFNEFVFNKTNDRSFFAMDGLLTHKMEPGVDTRLLFYNNVRYRAQFEQKFSYSNGKLFAPRVNALLSHIPELKADVMGLPLLNTSAYLLILQPDKGVNLTSVSQRLRTVDVRQLPSKLNPSPIDITMKKIFKYKYILLRDALREAGIKSVFDLGAAELIAFNKEVPFDDALVITGINLLEYGIDTETEKVHTHNVVVKQPDSDEYAKFEALGPLIYAIVDKDRVYVMGRSLKTVS
ncbi:hypothetical protein KR200_008833 [Drosophila serrata]|nr:hypothetical protein KR200_008833 [Drosophila serrata]